jgi:hypothetical protein
MTLAVVLFQRGAVAPSLFEGREGLQQSTKTPSNKTCNNLTHSAHSIYGSALHDTHDVQQLPQQKTCNKPRNKRQGKRRQTVSAHKCQSVNRWVVEW